MFVEGQSTSLDRQIYQLIYPNVSVIPQGNCREVEKAVNGIKKTENIHWINAYGLIDTDDRTPEQIQALLEKGVAAIPFYSVEALYYHLHIIEKVAQKISELTGQDAPTLYQNATENIISDISQHKERLCSKLCEKKIRNDIMLSMPKHRDIQQRGEFNVTFDLNQVLQNEENYFDNLVTNSNQLELLTRYPIRETQVLNRITSGLGLNKEQYESTVRKLILDSTEIRDFYRTLLQPLTELIE